MNNNRSDRIKADEETYRILLSHGANPNKEHKIDFFFVGDPDKLSDLESELTRQGYNKLNRQQDSSLLVEKTLILALMESKIITESLETLANKYDVKFDGWGTVAQK